MNTNRIFSDTRVFRKKRRRRARFPCFALATETTTRLLHFRFFLFLSFRDDRDRRIVTIVGARQRYSILSNFSLGRSGARKFEEESSSGRLLGCRAPCLAKYARLSYRNTRALHFTRAESAVSRRYVAQSPCSQLSRAGV